MASLAFSRNFGTITFSGGAITIEGITNPDDQSPHISELHVLLIALPGWDPIVHHEKQLPLPAGKEWDVTIPNAPPPFDQPGQQVMTVGVATYTDPATGAKSTAVWGGPSEIT